MAFKKKRSCLARKHSPFLKITVSFLKRVLDMQASNWEQVKDISLSPEPGVDCWGCSVPPAPAPLSWVCSTECAVPLSCVTQSLSPLQCTAVTALLVAVSQPTWKCDGLGRHRADSRWLQGAGLIHGVHRVYGALGKRRKSTFFFFSIKIK